MSWLGENPFTKAFNEAKKKVAEWDAEQTENEEKDPTDMDCWDGYKKDGTKSGTGKNAGKQVNNCVKEEEVEERDAEEIENDPKEGYAVVYNNPKSEKHGGEKHFKDMASAKKHADKGNSVDKVGGKYTVHKTDAKGRIIKEEEVEESTKEYAKSLQQIADKAKKEKITSSDLKTLEKLAKLMASANEETELDEAEYKVGDRMRLSNKNTGAGSNQKIVKIDMVKGKKRYELANGQYVYDENTDVEETELDEATYMVTIDKGTYGGVKSDGKPTMVSARTEKEALEKAAKKVKINPKLIPTGGYQIKSNNKEELETALSNSIVAEKVDPKLLKQLKDLDAEDARMIIQGLPKKIQQEVKKALGLKEKVDGRTKAYKETVARLMAKKKATEEIEEAGYNDAEGKDYEELAKDVKDDHDTVAVKEWNVSLNGQSQLVEAVDEKEAKRKFMKEQRVNPVYSAAIKVI